ncbi:MAG TPA: hypothetical protein VEI47_05085, partial [Gemmatimonadales bacterium]|nr:hypothetical protein [Gemmatimonadales bacterium]
SLAILAEGKTVGLQVTSLSGSGDSLVYLERSILGTALNQTTSVVFDTALHMRRLDQDGTAQGQHTSIKIAYGSGRVRGTATVPAAGGPKTTTIDTAVSETIIDDNAVQAILPLLKWDVNTRWTFEVFSSGENRIRTLTLTAADLTRIRVPAGEFECYRADVTGGPQPLSFYVTSTAPHRVVKIELEHAPIEFVALNP